ncbi:MAG: glycerol-3-phosphate dehydrogenase/oxidase [Bacteroidetes bacterium]|nr:glycerol-3-phosphate dehydrogenase/oxidase [Bacteroidota bacterium]
MDRAETIAKITSKKEVVWDFIIIGGGASGMGVALDASSRGFSVLLLEQFDFGKGTSSRSTKLIHGGLRYLAQGNISLIIEALKERGFLLKNAPHLVKKCTFIIPLYSWKEALTYWLGLKVYSLLALRRSIGKSFFINKGATIKHLPNLKSKNLKGGIIYQDARFDDARLLIALARTCDKLGALMLNYAKVTALHKSAEGRLNGLCFSDKESGKTYTVKGKAIINATGIFSDDILKMGQPGLQMPNIISQGAHLVIEKSFLANDSEALMIPNTSDGRVLFIIPWYGKLLAGTTDILVDKAMAEPVALSEEVDFILKTAGEYLAKAPSRADVLSVFAGQRPLAVTDIKGSQTKDVSRSHKIMVAPNKLISLSGGKWTTFRKMGEDTVDMAIKVAGLALRKSTSGEIKIHGYTANSNGQSHLDVYGSEKETIQAMIAADPSLSTKLHKDYPYTKAELLYAIREEMARGIEDFLARRIRILFLDAAAACQMAPLCAQIMAKELGKDEEWEKEQVEEFKKLSENYLLI